MRCPACEHEVRPDARFCDGCGARLRRDCPNCSRELRLGARFCDGCGQPVERREAVGTTDAASDTHEAARPAKAPQRPEAERRQLSVLFCDLVDSTRLATTMDPEDWREVVRGYQAAAGKAVEEFAGHVAQYLGDGLLVYFGWPQAHEDDAERAVRAGLGIVDAVGALGSDLSVRIGIHTGPVVVGEMGQGESKETLALGDTTNRAARLQDVAEPNTVVLSAATLRLVSGIFVTRDLGEQALKGIAEPVRAFRALQASGVRSRLDVLAAGELTPFVGRDQELGLLEDRFAQVHEGRGQVVLIQGEAGIGKSRLVQAFREGIAEHAHSWLECRGSPYTQDSALQPVIELQRRGLGFRAEDASPAKLRAIAGGVEAMGFDVGTVVPLMAKLHGAPLGDDYVPPRLSPEGVRKKTLALLVEWLLRLGQRQPLVLLMEDLHWMDPSTIELLGQILEQIPTAPVLLLATFRPDFEAPWGARSHVTPMLLSRFTRTQLGELVRKAARDRDLPEDSIEEILRRADGVPLFAEELTRVVLEANPEPLAPGERPTLHIPDTLQDSLMARLDALGPVKELAQLASVLGREFDYDLLLAVSPMKEAELREAIAVAVREELFYQRGVPPEASYLFKHALIRDAAYDSMLRSTRRRHHRRTAETLIDRMPALAEAQPEMVAHHWTGAGEREPAIEWWERAGQAARTRVAHEEAIRHFRAGLEQVARLSRDAARDGREIDLLVPLGTSLVAAHGYTVPEVERVFERGRELCNEREEPRRAGIIHYYLGSLHAMRGQYERGLKSFFECERIGRAHGDDLLTVAALADSGQVYFQVPRLAEGLRQVSQACKLYDPERHRFIEAGFGEDVGISGWCWLAYLQLYAGHPDASQTSVSRARSLAESLGDPYTSASVDVFSSIMAGVRRDWTTARALARRVLMVSSEQGFAFWELAGSGLDAWMTGLTEHDPEAIDRYTEILARQASSGDQSYAGLLLGVLVELQLTAGRCAEGAQTATGALEITAAIGQHFNDAELHRLRAECFREMPDREPDEVEAELRRAVEIARSQEAKWLELRAATSLARLWYEQGKRTEARELLQAAYDWFTEGFDTQDLKDANALLDELQ